MDSYASGGIGAVSVFALAAIYKLFHHFKCASKCCGKEASLNIDIEQSPVENKTAPIIK